MTPPTPPSPGAQLSDELSAFRHGRVPRGLRRRQIVKEAGELFSERGYDEAFMDELARRVGVSKPVIYSLVGSKEQLFHDVMVVEAEELAGRVARAVSGELDPERRLRAGALAFFRYVDERRAHWGSLVAADAAPVTREIAAVRRHQAALAARLIAEGAGTVGQPGRRPAAAHRTVGQPGRRPAAAHRTVGQPGRRPAAAHRTVGTPLESRLIDACAHATNGAFEALASWWQEHAEVAPEALAELAVRLLLPGLLALSGVELYGRGDVSTSKT